MLHIQGGQQGTCPLVFKEMSFGGPFTAISDVSSRHFFWSVQPFKKIPPLEKILGYMVHRSFKNNFFIRITHNALWCHCVKRMENSKPCPTNVLQSLAQMMPLRLSLQYLEFSRPPMLDLSQLVINFFKVGPQKEDIYWTTIYGLWFFNFALKSEREREREENNSAWTEIIIPKWLWTWCEKNCYFQFLII